MRDERYGYLYYKYYKLNIYIINAIKLFIGLHEGVEVVPGPAQAALQLRRLARQRLALRRDTYVNIKNINIYVGAVAASRDSALRCAAIHM